MMGSPTYTPLAGSENNKPIDQQRQPGSRPISQALSRTCAAVFVLALCSLVGFTLGRHSVTQAQCGKKLSTWSPALDAIEYQQIMFDGDFLAPSKFRGRPTKELDEAWHNISVAGIENLRIDVSELQHLNKNLSEKTQFIFDDGKDGAVVVLEVFHQLHCLNELRKRTWPGHYPSETGNEKVDRAHTDHCIEILRAVLMCNADVTPITLSVPEYQDDPAADFSTLHTCRNFDKILQYAKDHAIEYRLPD